MRIIFMGTPDFAVPALRTLSSSEHEIIAVFCQPDKPKGRKMQMVAPPVKEEAVRLSIPVYQPVKIKQQEYVDIIRDLKPDVAIVAAFGQILSKELLEIPRYGCINIHASLLPMYRGAAPIQWSILNGDSKTGVTIQQMNEGLDTGDILLTEEIPISDDETSDSLFDKLSLMGGDMALKVLSQMENGSLIRIPQGEATTPYAKMMTKEMGRIDWSEAGALIERKIRAFNSWPCAYTYIDGKQLKLWKAKLTAENPSMAAGECIVDKNSLKVKTGDVLLEVLELQLEGKKRMPVGDFLRGINHDITKLG